MLIRNVKSATLALVRCLRLSTGSSSRFWQSGLVTIAFIGSREMLSSRVLPLYTILGYRRAEPRAVAVNEF